MQRRLGPDSAYLDDLPLNRRSENPHGDWICRTALQTMPFRCSTICKGVFDVALRRARGSRASLLAQASGEARPAKTSTTATERAHLHRESCTSGVGVSFAGKPEGFIRSGLVVGCVDTSGHGDGLILWELWRKYMRLMGVGFLRPRVCDWLLRAFCWCSSGVERRSEKPRVVGATPTTSTT